MTAIINSVQPFVITVSSATSSNTATLSPAVNTSNSVIFPSGVQAASPTQGNFHTAFARFTLTSSVQVTLQRSSASNVALVGSGTVVEFASGVNSIQSGTITVTSLSSVGTAAINPVGPNAFVINEGFSIINATSFGACLCAVTLTSADLVSAFASTSADAKLVNYTVVDLTTAIVSTVQQVKTSAVVSSSSVDSVSITPVDTGYAMLIDGGDYRDITAGQPSSTISGFVPQLSSASVAFGRAVTVSTSPRVHCFTVVSFNPAALATTIQRGLITNAAPSTSISSTIAAVSSRAVLNNYMARAKSETALLPNQLNKLTLASTSVTADRQSSVADVVSGYEVIDFSTGVATGVSPDWKTQSMDDGVFRGLHPIDSGCRPFSIVRPSL